MATHVSYHETKPANYAPGVVIPVYGSSLAYEVLAANTVSQPKEFDSIVRIVPDVDILLRWSDDPTSGPQTFLPGAIPFDFYLEAGEKLRYTAA